MMAMEEASWGTWEELVLGGAVLRHGTDAWDAVAAELQTRTPFTFVFTPEQCEAKYEDLQERYSGYDSWFDELRSRRVDELRRELEKSEDSIGSLQTKLKGLNANGESRDDFESNTNQPESASPTENSDGFDSSSREILKDGLSAGSFTEETGRGWSEECQVVASVSSLEDDVKLDPSGSSEKEKVGCTPLEFVQGCLKKKRGKRKRKGCNLLKEGSVGNSDKLSSAACMCKEESSEGCNEEFRLPYGESGGCPAIKDTNVDLMGIFDSIVKENNVSVFRRRLESQRRARYKKMICRHVDLLDISSRISSGSITSANELFRDLLLLSYNALVYYPKNSSELRSALILRDLVTKALKQNSQVPSQASTSVGPPLHSNVSKQKTLPGIRPCNHSIAVKAEVAVKRAGTLRKEDVKKGSCVEKPEEPPLKKRGGGRPAKGGQKSGRIGKERANKGRKQGRRR